MEDDERLAAALSGGAPVDDEAMARATERLRAAAEREGLLDVAYATVDSPLGPLLAAATGRGLVMLSYLDGGVEPRLERLARELSPRIMEAPARLDPARRELEEYFAGRRRDFAVPIDWSLIRGFAREVLRSTAAIPFGQWRSYGEVSAAAGSPRASRATGNALGSNPIPIVIPCHRVLRSGGTIGGYTGGLERKRFLLALEAGEPVVPITA
jgi:methylated-DNA-[protein]-cysteine S-methyltransferase